MTMSSRSRRRVAILGLCAAGALTAGSMVASTAASASPAPASSGVTNPYSPAYGHSYRHGVMPTVGVNHKMQKWAAQHASPNAATGPETLSYGGGIDGIGVQSGAKNKVYLVFYGNQWGTSSTNGNGDLTFSGDPSAAAPVAQEMFKGIGTGNERWSADLTQWCDGPNVASGATSCPSNANFVPYQAGGVLAGVWYDNSGASPSAATGHQLGVEAVNAAGHFGNTSAAANRNSYYVIMSPHGTNPDNYQGQYCAWHDYNGDSTLTGGPVSSNYGDIAFSNQPYNIDSGQGCGQNFVNAGSAGTLDGWTMSLGHEWHEMMSDTNPAGGWTNHTGSSYNGQENSDECAYKSSGVGAAANVTFATGTFAEQGSWSNDTNACAITHPIVGGGSSNTVTVTNPGNQSGKVGTATSLQLHASDSGSGTTLTYSATGLPAGLSLNASTGLISGTPTTAATYSVTAKATDNTGASGSTSFTWTISSAGGGGNTVTVTNPGNQSGTVGTATSLQLHASDSGSGTTLTYSATGLPAGLSLNASKGLISGTPTTAATYSVTAKATDNTGASGSTSFTWTISAAGGGCSGQLFKNPGFESGSANWSASSSVINTDGMYSRTGVGYAWLDGYGSVHTDTLAQTVSIPAGCKATLSYYAWIDSQEGTSYPYDTLTITVGGTTVQTLSNVNQGTGYALYSVNLSSFAGKTVSIKWTGREDASLATSFLIDDTAVTLG